jgi:uncharacterized membrane protein
MNKTLVGDVKIVSNLDNERGQANVNLNITNHGLETMNIAGVYTLGKETEDKLDFDVKMDHTEAIIFEPFIKGNWYQILRARYLPILNCRARHPSPN